MTQVAVDDVDLWRDRSLVELAQAGDVDAFGALYDRYFRRLERFCVKRLGDPSEAEEAAQEAFTRAWRALPAFGGERRFYPWITVIASRICVDAVRRQARLEVGEVEDAPVVEPGYSRLESEGDLAILERALGRVSHRHREVLELRERHGWSYQHIADHYQVSVGTVEALLWRARKALRREFLGLCSSIAALPVIRRWTLAGKAPAPGTLAAVGSVGTVVVLAVGAAAPYAATAAPMPTSAAAIAALLPAALAPATHQVTVAAPAVAVAGPFRVTPRASGFAWVPAAAAAPTGTAAGASLRALLPQERLMSPSAGAEAAGQKPIVISTGPHAPVIGIDPGVPVPAVHVQLGGLP